MKRILLLLIACSTFQNLNAQAVFCPPGAEWKYFFFWTAGGHQPSQYPMPETIRYVRDSVVNNNTVKVLTHKWFYLKCGQVDTGLTLIQQRHDTVFMRNYLTDHNWEILYNFGAQPGQSWQTTIRDQPGAAFAGMTYTITVDSVKSITVNSFLLKHLFVHYTGPNIPSYQATITERFGSQGFLFNYQNILHGSCDGDWFNNPLCYTDKETGTIQYTEKPCDFGFWGLGLKEYQSSGIRIYPNPANSFLKIEMQNSASDYRVQLNDISGKLLLETVTELNSQEMLLNLDGIAKGFYIVKVYKGKELQATRKVVKE